MSYERAVALAASAVVVSLLGTLSSAPGATQASAAETATTLFSTPPGLLHGEGGQFDQPWWDAVTASWGGTAASYGPDSVDFLSSPDMDQAREDLVTGNADFAVAEGPLTGPLTSSLADAIGVFSDETGTASQNGLTVAYVPIAMEAVAVPFIVIPPGGCTGAEGTATDPYGCTLLSTMNMSPTTLETAFEGITPSWDTPAIQADNGGTGFSSILSSEIQGPYPANLIDADASNGALTNYFITTDAQSAWDAWAKSYAAPPDTVLYTWPKKAPLSQGNQFQESDMIRDLVPRDPDAPGQANVMSFWAEGWNITAVPWSWTFPAYTLYPNANLPDVSIENAAGGFVEPSLTSMEAAFANATLDPASNLVSFGTSTTDETAYPAQMMTADYLEVPLNGLPADKATTLAGFIQYLLSAKGQSAICSAGYLPVLQSGLNSSLCSLPVASGATAALSSQVLAADNTVVTELQAEAKADATTTSTSSTTTSSTTTSSTTTSSTTTSSTTTSSTTTSSTTTSSTTTSSTTTSSTTTSSTTTSSSTTTTTSPTTTSTTTTSTTPASTTTTTPPTTTASTSTTTTSPTSTTTSSTTTTMPPSTTTTAPPATTATAAAATTTTAPAATSTSAPTTPAPSPTPEATPATATSSTTTSTTPISKPKRALSTPTTASPRLTTTTKAPTPPTTKVRVRTSTRRTTPKTTKPEIRGAKRTRGAEHTRGAKHNRGRKHTRGTEHARRTAGKAVVTSVRPGTTGSDGSPVLAMTGSGALRVAGLGLGLLALGEASRQRLRRRRAPKDRLQA